MEDVNPFILVMCNLLAIGSQKKTKYCFNKYVDIPEPNTMTVNCDKPCEVLLKLLNIPSSVYIYNLISHKYNTNDC